MKRVSGVGKVKSSIFYILWIVSGKILNETFVIVCIAKIFENFKQMQYRWVVVHNNWSVVKRHILFVDKYQDVQFVDSWTLNNIEYIVFMDRPAMIMKPITIKQTCVVAKQKVFYAKDEMQEFRQKFKNLFKISYIGHIFTLSVCPASYKLLNEWLVYDVNEVNALSVTICFEPPHVVVFDMDSTLITEEEEVQIRDDNIYCALDELKSMNCVLCLWSYGTREHVVYSLNKVGLKGYFNIILAEGKYVGDYNVSATTDTYNNVVYKNTPFYLDLLDKKNIPKSPRVVLWYLQKHNINAIKTITLVDDLIDNNIGYDNFVNLSTCPVPVQDWDKWHNKIVDFIKDYDYTYIN
ncbi:38k protein [Psilogramma increta granulovirus]|uniref:38k protein n=1 Tax=Psilogramma increta granulovirus TaxID=2953508 RepID=A0A977XV09_9BBAC|nr:38k protein [Psilogramma increta granulovirus]